MPFIRIPNAIGLALFAIAFGSSAAYAADEVQNSSTTTTSEVP